MAELKTKIKLQISAGEATPAPPVGPALAPHGIRMGEFCNAFNDKTRDKQGWTIPVEISIFDDGSFTFELKEPPTSQLIKKAVGIEKGSGTPLMRKVGKITKEQLKEIAQRKMPDLNTNDLEKAIKIVEGTAKAMGVEVE